MSELINSQEELTFLDIFKEQCALIYYFGDFNALCNTCLQLIQLLFIHMIHSVDGGWLDYYNGWTDYYTDLLTIAYPAIHYIDLLTIAYPAIHYIDLLPSYTLY